MRRPRKRVKSENVQSREIANVDRRVLTAREFQGLAHVPPETEWFANIDNPRTRLAYQIDIKDFMGFVGIVQPEEFRVVTRAHVIAWRKSLEGRTLSPATIRRKLSALSSLFDYLCERNAVAHNPVDAGGFMRRFIRSCAVPHSRSRDSFPTPRAARRAGCRGSAHGSRNAGNRSFHDFPAGKDWNIDHVAVGPGGVFAIETKTRSKRQSTSRQEGRASAV